MRLALQQVVFSGVFAFAVSGCVTVIDGDSGSGSGSGGMGGQGSSVSSSGSGVGSVGSGAAGGAGGMGAGGASGGTMCGGFAGLQCAMDEYCNFPDDLCGGADGTGICEPRPQACPEFYSPTCACDGKVYGNPCDAAGGGSDVSNLGSCPAPSPGMFGCGHSFCESATQYCQKTYSDVPGLPDSYTCAPLPAGCGATPSCACVGDPCGAPIPSSCSLTPDGGLLVTCAGG